jgi:platelet-activating factor acetylhydrolase
MVKKFFAIEEPDRVMRLNVRAVLQLLRAQGIEVSATSAADMEVDDKGATDTKNDMRILGKNEEVRGWNWLSTDVTDMGDVDEEASAKGTPASTAASSQATLATEPMKVVVDNELLKENSTTTERV